MTDPTPLAARLRDPYAVAPDTPITPVTARVVRAGALAVKSFGPEAIDRAVLESSILRHLEGGDGYRVQAIVRTRTNDDLLRDEGGALLATRWEAGAHLDHTAIPVAGWWNLGRSLASLHRRLEAPGALVAPVRLGALVRARDLAAERRLLLADRDAARRRDDPSTETVLRLLDARLRLLDARGTCELRAPDDALVHNDFNQHNYLFTDPATPPLILDWERALGAPREYEIARCLAHLPVVRPEAAGAFLEGYQGARSIDAAALPSCLAVALTEHAVKRWPVARWLAGEPDAGARIESLTPVVASLADGVAALEAYYRDALRRR